MLRIVKEVTLEKVLAAVEADDMRGFCTACGAEAFCVEPDARKYRCESCGEKQVYGAAAHGRFLMRPNAEKYSEASKFVRAIRNSVKRQYAEDYLYYLMKLSRGDGLPAPKDPKNLSYMAAQAVRMRLNAIMGGE